MGDLFKQYSFKKSKVVRQNCLTHNIHVIKCSTLVFTMLNATEPRSKEEKKAQTLFSKRDEEASVAAVLA